MFHQAARQFQQNHFEPMLYFQDTTKRSLSDYKLPAPTRLLLERSLGQLNLALHIDCWGADQILINQGLAGSAPPLNIRIDHPGVVRLFVQGRDPFQLLEAYLHGLLHFDAAVDSIAHFADCVQSARPTWLEYVRGAVGSYSLPKLALKTGQRPWHSLPLGSKERDREAVRYHYDVGNEFYQLWLGPDPVYSCAYFARTETDLAQAQEAKLDLICRRLELRPGEHLLDIGCGWGALLRWAVKKYGVIGHGITLSEEQWQFNQKKIKQENLEDRLKVEIVDYRDLANVQLFDKVVSIEMIEQVRIENYPVYFGKALRCLKPGGLFLCQAITTIKERAHHDLAERFIADYIFPDGELSSLPKLIAAAKQSGWDLILAESWRPHYAMTLRRWAANLQSQGENAEQLVGLRHVRLWMLYLIGCALAYEANRLGVYQLLLHKSSDVIRFHANTVLP